MTTTAQKKPVANDEAWFGGGRVPKTQGWQKARTGRATSRKWVNFGAGCWVTINRGELGVHVGFAHEYEGFKLGMTAAEAVEWCRAKWAEKVAQN
jgi:hypothetical protein